MTEKRQIIINAAVEVIAEHGYHGAQVSKIAKQAGVADGTIYLYFKNKDDILFGLFEDKVDQLMATMTATSAASPEDQLKTFVRNHVEWLALDRSLAACVQLELRQSKKEMRNKLNHLLIPYHRLLENILVKGIDAGVFDPAMNLKFARQLIFGAIDEAISTWVVADFKYDITAQFDDLYYLISKAVTKEDHHD
ncbi:TetR/AcrR family transcriptional regulator [Macrococcus equipercicus]|uniref:TetR/AcrR family transcriptional regulator n=1 Tax=Macrococcus equipercicus TaxID=69967 RepID=A0A9Q9BKZ0_9STAP|nr:TetR/AcrR family transcriptional regulator [Macrococcus equipercicus]KAA1039966.1 TetR/AcrR family transcriptional regulator [Macrococcus equipercicus]UTH13100.1 TetR/AcrR family transcriptional regulator [Macrococcus equipercicus]